MSPLVTYGLPAVSLAIAALPVTGPIALRHDKTDQESVALAKRFDATVRCLPDGSGTLIGERWVVTAAHVGRGLSPFSPRVQIGGVEFPVRQVLYHPGSISDGHRPPEVDLALVELEDGVEGIDPVALYPNADEEGRQVFVVGYGDFGPAGGEFTRGDEVRRAATNTVERAEAGRLVIDFDAPPEGTELEGVGAPGDSGGPLFLETEEGLFLAGVSFASMGDPPGAYGVLDLYVRVSDHLEWIAEARAAAEGAPPRRPVIVDVEEGFPDGEHEALLESFFQSFASDEDGAMARFGEEHRSARSRRNNPSAAFNRRMEALREELGALRPARLATIEPGHWAVLAEGRDEWHAVHFFLTEEGEAVRLDGLDVLPESPPPAESGDADSSDR
jgi:hypothetical protein